LAPRITQIVARNPGGTSSIYGSGNTISVVFDVPTDMAKLGSCENDKLPLLCCARLICNAPILNKNQVDQMLDFSQALGRDYKGRWILNATTLEIDIIDAFGAAPPAIGFLIISTAPERGLPIRTANGESVGAHSSPSPPLIGDFGTSRIEITSIAARDPIGLDPTYNSGDTITVLIHRSLLVDCCLFYSLA
jgi:hypothetical protein